MIINHLPWKDSHQSDIHIMANSQKKKGQMTESFQKTLTWFQRLVRPFPFECTKESLAALCKRPALTFSFPFCAASRAELLSCVRGAWTAAKPVCGSSYFDTPKHLPSLKHGRERHRENNRERASFQPLLAGWSITDCLPLKPIKGQCSSKSQEDTPKWTLPVLHSLFPLRHLSFPPSEVRQGGYPRRKCLSSEGGACVLYLFLHYFKHSPGCYLSYVIECWVLITACQKKLHSSWTTLLLLEFFYPWQKHT